MKSDTDREHLEEAQERFATFVDDFASLSLATVDESGEPYASYAPFVVDDQRRFFLFVSDLSRHTGNMRHSGRASLLLIQDEGQREQIFARQRL